LPDESACASGVAEDLPLRAAIAAGIDAFASAYDTIEPQSRMRDFLEAQAKRKATPEQARPDQRAFSPSQRT
jgi:hypothetical protein